MSADKTYEVTGEKRLYEGFLNVDAVTYRVTGNDGKAGEPLTREVMERGDSAAILMLNEEQQSVVLVRQLRIAARRPLTPSDAWLLELPAGVIEATSRINPGRAETPEECARREANEETGYVVGNMEKIACILPSPGGTSERIHIYFAKVKNTDRGGTLKPDPGERIEVVHKPVAEFLATAEASDVVDAKLLVAAQWLKRQLPAVTKRNVPLGPGGASFNLIGHSTGLPQVIGYKTGAVDEIRGVDAWINAENTDMQMARFFEKGVSASIRYLGAARGSDGAIYEDTIADGLRKAVAGQVFVRPGSVLVTGSGSLYRTHQVKKIFHVACVHHQRGGVSYADIDAGGAGMRQAFTMAEAINRSLWHSIFHPRLQPIRSILVPLIGAGNGGANVKDVARKLIGEAFAYLKANPDAQLRQIYFIAFMESERQVIDELLKGDEYASLIVPGASAQHAGAPPRTTAAS